MGKCSECTVDMQSLVLWLRAVAAFNMLTNRDEDFCLMAEYTWTGDRAGGDLT